MRLLPLWVAKVEDKWPDSTRLGYGKMEWHPRVARQIDVFRAILVYYVSSIYVWILLLTSRQGFGIELRTLRQI